MRSPVACPAHERLADAPDPRVREHLAAIADDLADVVAQIAAKGGCPGTALVVMTDLRNAPWFYAPGHWRMDPAHEDLGPDFPATLGRRLHEVLPIIQAACPGCARALVATPRTHLPVYLRIGATAETFLGETPFAEHLWGVARAAVLRERAGRTVPRG